MLHLLVSYEQLIKLPGKYMGLAVVIAYGIFQFEFDFTENMCIQA